MLPLKQLKYTDNVMRNNSRNTRNSSANKGSQKKIPSTTATTTGSKSKQTAPKVASKQKQEVMVATSGKVAKPVAKPPTNLPKYPSRAQQLQKYAMKKQQKMKEIKWAHLPYSHLATIVAYSCTTLFEVYQLSKVCSIWRRHLVSEGGCYLWNGLKGGENVRDFGELKLYLQRLICQQQEKMSFQFEKYFTKLFNYGSTKQNIPNKLIDKLNLQLEVSLNGKTFFHPFKLRTFNFSSYLCAKIQQIRQYTYNFTTPHNMFKDKITLDMNFRSRKYKVSHNMSKKYIPEDIVDGAIRQKAFNYFLDRNFVLTFFEGDDHFLYIFFEISVLELVNIFRKAIKAKHQQSLAQKTKKLPLYKQLCETQFQDFVQYVKFQADFEIHFSYHNSLKQIFTHCDTKVFPIEYDKKHAYFQVKIDDSFEKQATYKLDNKMGMSESIDDLYLLDFVLKDRDRFLIIFSGFIYARKATQKQRESLDNYFDFNENQIKIIESKQEKYSICFMIVEQGKKNLMKKVKFTLFA